MKNQYVVVVIRNVNVPIVPAVMDALGKVVPVDAIAVNKKGPLRRPFKVYLLSKNFHSSR